MFGHVNPSIAACKPSITSALRFGLGTSACKPQYNKHCLAVLHFIAGVKRFNKMFV